MAYIRKLSSGNYQVQVRLTGLKPISRTFSNRLLAKEFVREVEGNSELARKLDTPISQVRAYTGTHTLAYTSIYGDTHF